MWEEIKFWFLKYFTVPAAGLSERLSEYIYKLTGSEAALQASNEAVIRLDKLEKQLRKQEGARRGDLSKSLDKNTKKQEEANAIAKGSTDTQRYMQWMNAIQPRQVITAAQLGMEARGGELAGAAGAIGATKQRLDAIAQADLERGRVSPNITSPAMQAVTPIPTEGALERPEVDSGQMHVYDETVQKNTKDSAGYLETLVKQSEQMIKLLAKLVDPLPANRGAGAPQTMQVGYQGIGASAKPYANVDYHSMGAVGVNAGSGALGR